MTAVLAVRRAIARELAQGESRAGEHRLIVNERYKAEGKFRAMLEAAPDAIIIMDGEGNIVLVNARTEILFGYARSELLGQKIEFLLPQRYHSTYRSDRARFHEGPEASDVGVELHGLRKDGTEFPIEIRLSLLETEEGRLVSSSIRDIGVRKDSERRLAEMEDRYHRLLEAAPDTMVVVNHAGEIVLLNLQAEQEFGYRRAELLGQNIKKIIPERAEKRLIVKGHSSPADTLGLQIGTEIELTGRRKDGSEFPIEIMWSPLESAERILVIRDISVRRQTERLKDEFVATVSHELRTPLTSISGSLGLLVGQWASKLPESAGRLLTIAHTNSQRLARLLNDILDIEKLESGRVVFNLGQVAVRTLVEQAIEDNRGYAEGYGVRVSLDVNSADLEVYADPDRLSQVVTNLLSNAIKFSPTSGEVMVAVKRHASNVRITVRDHGPGVPEEFKPHVFEKFAQAEATNSRRKGGTGLGLSIVKEIVERLGGNVSFENADGGGAIFSVDLPVWDAKARQTLRGAIAAPSRERPRILHVDDDYDVLALVALQLRAMADVVSADSVESARRILATDRIDLAVLDIALGQESGLDLLPDLRATSGDAIPVVIFSVHRADMGCDEQVHVALSKSHTSLANLGAAVRDRLALLPEPLAREVA